MQATVASYDESTRSGTVVTDHGKTLEFAATTLAEHIRHLRPGQRVSLDMTADKVTGLRLW
jgi:cold shock CspA family protein